MAKSTRLRIISGDEGSKTIYKKPQDLFPATTETYTVDTVVELTE